MYSVSKKQTSFLEIKHSKFYGFLIRVDNIEMVESILASLKQEYKDATHYPYAYIIDNKNKAYDDHEPSGTAGVPLLNCLQAKDLNHVLGVVVRYYGGIKLGANGLIRAYQNTIKATVTELVPLIPSLVITITFDYSNQKPVTYLLKSYDIINQTYNTIITYELIIKESDLNDLTVKLKPYLITFKAKERILY